MHESLAQWLFAIGMVASAGTAAATDSDSGVGIRPANGVFKARLDNDLFGSQDQGYTSGMILDWTRAPGRGAEDVRSFYVGQALFTPINGRRTELIANDRPYAAFILFGAGRSRTAGDSMIRNDIQFGLLGPGAGGRRTQYLVHQVIGADDFRGWNNQLRNEPLFGLVHVRYRRLFTASRDGRMPDTELIGNWGGRVGNLFTWANAGMEYRFGSRLPDDFGSSPLRPGVLESRPQAAPSRSGLHFVGFVSANARLVARDVTLDGNTFRSSHRVDKRPAVADLGYGFSVSLGDVQVTFGRFHRTREFDGQRQRPVYGSVTVSLTY